MNNNISETDEQSGSKEAQAVGAPGRAGCPPAGLPSHYYDNCIKKEEYKKSPLVALTPNQKKTRHKMIMAVEWMVAKHGLEKVGVLTLSFGVPGSGKGSYATWALRQQAKAWDFVQARWHSFCTNVIADRYEDWVCVFEMHGDGVWHIHVVVATKADIRTGTDIETLSNYKLPYWMRRGKHLRNEALAAEWKELREVACKYRFGRVELLPVKKSGRAVGRYLGDYLAKTYSAMAAGGRCRLIRFSSNINKAISPTGKFSIVGLGQLIHRTRLGMVARMVNLQDYGDFAEYFGPRWHYRLRSALASVPIPFRFGKGDFASGFAFRTLRDYALNPRPYLNEREQVSLDCVSHEMWRRLADALGENSEELILLRSRRPGDNSGDAPATLEDLHGDLFQDPLCPF